MKLCIPKSCPALAALGAAVLTLAGCASSAGIAPVTEAIQPVQLGLPAADASVPVAAALDAQWWQAWNDPALSDLMVRALAAHPSLQVAQARLARSAAAVAGEEGSAGLKLNATADATRQRFSANSVYPLRPWVVRPKPWAMHSSQATGRSFFLAATARPSMRR